MSISVGAVGTASTVVTPENTAAAVGSGAHREEVAAALLR